MAITRRDLITHGAAVGAGAAAGVIAGASVASAMDAPKAIAWTHEADVVVVGSGACGLPAALTAREAGASVIVVEAEPDVGGHAICNGGHLPLGGGTRYQKAAGVEDFPDLVFQDLTDWSIVQPNGYPDYRYNDREVIRAFADNSAAALEWLADRGVKFLKDTPDGRAGSSHGNSVPRQMHVVIGEWMRIQTGKMPTPEEQTTVGSGTGLIRPIEAAARKAGVEIFLEHRMTAIHRENPKSGRVLGIEATNNGTAINIRARKAVIVATGGSTTNVNFRRMFDPRLTEEYCGIAGQPWSNQDASGELAGMAVGASLWGAANQTLELGDAITKPGSIGCQYNYVNLQWFPGSRVFDKARATGLKVADWQNVITVNMLGKRFYDETGTDFPGNQYGQVKPYTPDSYTNVKSVTFSPSNWLNAAMAGIGDGHNGGGPIWAIFDADAAAREKWDPTPPQVDLGGGFCFTADSIATLASKIQMKYQRVKMPPENLEATVARYNSFVESGIDADFGKPKPLYKIAKAPFHAAWCTPVLHDTRAGLRINAKCQVVDMNGEVIPGLYCGGESAGGFSMHGMARCVVQGRIAAASAVAETIA